MRSYAWLEVQRGFLAFSRGGYPEARSHYDIAEAAYPGYWLVGEYQAELLGAESRHAEAIELFGRLGAANHRPDLQQAIAELYEIAEQPEAARYWQGRALAGYLQSAQRGEVHYYHHLTDYYADVVNDGAAAVTWAREDLQMRAAFARPDRASARSMVPPCRAAHIILQLVVALARFARLFLFCDRPL